MRPSADSPVQLYDRSKFGCQRKCVIGMGPGMIDVMMQWVYHWARDI